MKFDKEIKEEINMEPLEQCKCLTLRERSALMNAFSFAEGYIIDDLKKHAKESSAYRMMNANLTELEYIKFKVKNTPDCY